MPYIGHTILWTARFTARDVSPHHLLVANDFARGTARGYGYVDAAQAFRLTRQHGALLARPQHCIGRVSHREGSPTMMQMAGGCCAEARELSQQPHVLLCALLAQDAGWTVCSLGTYYGLTAKEQHTSDEIHACMASGGLRRPV